MTEIPCRARSSDRIERPALINSLLLSSSSGRPRRSRTGIDGLEDRNPVLWMSGPQIMVRPERFELSTFRLKGGSCNPYELRAQNFGA